VRIGAVSIVALAGALAASVAVVVACGGPSDPGTQADAADTSPPACPPPVTSCATTPSYASDIVPIVNRTCANCHAPGGVEASIDLTQYSVLNKEATTAYANLIHCLMPPADAGADAMLAAADRAELEEWILCGAPDN
jgi:hypothetical protein